MVEHALLLISLLFWAFINGSFISSQGAPHQILLDSDIDTDDFFALLYLLKQNRSEFNLKAITINANTWSDAGHSVNHVYDILYMMGRDDIPVGIGGDGGIHYNSSIEANVGGYLPLIEQDVSTIGGCRYRQSIPPGGGGRLDVDSNYGVRRELLPQGKRHYMPLVQRTTQEVMVEALSSGPTVVLLIGAHTNFALFLMTHPHLKKNVEHIYIMGGGVRSRNPKGCCPRNATSCTPTQCGDRGNLFTGYNSNPFAEFNIYGDPFAAYQVFHSGIPITLVPLDATNTILITEAFFNEFEANQKTYEAQYVFESLRIVRDTWFDNLFYSSYFMWDSFTSGVAVSSIRNGHLNSDANEFAELEYMNVTVVTSNAPYGINDGSNPFFDNRRVPKFKLKKGGVHSGHVQTGLEDPFCFVPNGKGKCQDAYTQEISGSEGVRILVATKAKENPDKNSSLTRAFYPDFLNVLNRPSQSAKFNLKTEFPYYREVLYIPSFKEKKLGIPMIFDMDMDPGDIIILFYLLKMPVELINLKAITINGNGWANAATIDIVYDVLHMMGRDDIKVGLGEFFALNQSYSSNSAVGNCKYSKAIPYGSGGFIDTDSLFGLARDLPRSPRRYTAQNSVKFGAIRDTEHPEWRQPEAQEIFQNVQNGLKSGEKITILATGPLSNIAQFLSTSNGSNIERLYIVGGNLDGDNASTGNLFSVPENKRAEFNFFLDPLAARNVISSNVNITLIPLKVQRNVSDLERLRTVLKRHRKTPEAAFVHRLVSRMLFLSHRRHYYRHLGMFVGEVVGGPLLAQQKDLKVKSERLPVRVIASGNVSNDGVIIVDKHNGRLIDVVKEMDSSTYYSHLAKWLNRREQSAVLASFSAQTRLWRTPPTM